MLSWVLIAAAGWVVLTALIGPFAWGLGRAAAIGDRRQEELMRALAADHRFVERRSGHPDRRAVRRPWSTSSPGRRAEDALRRERAEAQRELLQAQARLEEIETRRSA